MNVLLTDETVRFAGSVETVAAESVSVQCVRNAVAQCQGGIVILGVYVWGM